MAHNVLVKGVFVIGVLGVLEFPGKHLKDSPPGLSYIGPSLTAIGSSDVGGFALPLPLGGAANLNPEIVSIGTSMCPEKEAMHVATIQKHLMVSLTLLETCKLCFYSSLLCYAPMPKPLPYYAQQKCLLCFNK